MVDEKKEDIESSEKEINDDVKIEEDTMKEDNIEETNKEETHDDEEIVDEEVHKKHHHKHHGHIAHKRHYEGEGSNLWKWTSIALFLLLIVSIFSDGFSSFTGTPSVEKVSSEVTKIALKYGTPEVSTLANEINTKLIDLKTAIGTTDTTGSDSTATTLEVDLGTLGGEGSMTEGAVKLDFYVMSQCPYGVQVEDAIAPVLKELGSAVDFNLDFIVNDNGDGTFDSLHGQNEVLGDIVQLCAIKYNPDKYMDMIVCMNKNSGKIPGNWENCAEDAKLNVESIKTCYEGEEGKKLMSESVKRSEDAQASGSPTIYINDNSYRGARDSDSFKRALCVYLQGNPACKDIPACSADQDCPREQGKVAKCENPGEKDAKCSYTDDVKFEIIVVNDKTCASCDSGQLEAVNMQYFPGATHRTVDVSSDEGKKLIKDYEIVYAPTLLFEKKVQESATWVAMPQFSQFFEEKGDYMKLLDSATGATHFVDETKRKEFEEKIGLNTGDNKPQIDFFVMSYCPYGNQAEEGIEPVYKLLGDKAVFNPRYVIYSNYQGGGSKYCLDAESKYCSMHGIQELNQDVREICVNKYFGIGKWFEFVLAMNKDCSASNADSCWEKVAEGIKLDTKKIKDCEKNEALELLKIEKDLNDALGVSGSPTIFIEGQEYSGGRASENFKQALCDAFDTPPTECESTLGQAAAEAQGNCG